MKYNRNQLGKLTMMTPEKKKKGDRKTKTLDCLGSGWVGK